MEEELKKMPFMIDLTENEVFAREFDRVRQEGMRSGLIEGRVKGEVEGRAKGEVEGRVKGEVEGRAKGKSKRVAIWCPR